MAPDPRTPREILEDRWRETVAVAKHEHELAAAKARDILKQQQRWPFPVPDGSISITQALKNENRTRDEWRRVLDIFHDLILRGKRPEE